MKVSTGILTSLGVSQTLLKRFKSAHNDCEINFSDWCASKSNRLYDYFFVIRHSEIEDKKVNEIKDFSFNAINQALINAKIDDENKEKLSGFLVSCQEIRRGNISEKEIARMLDFCQELYEKNTHESKSEDGICTFRHPNLLALASLSVKHALESETLPPSFTKQDAHWYDSCPLAQHVGCVISGVEYIQHETGFEKLQLSNLTKSWGW